MLHGIHSHMAHWPYLRDTDSSSLSRRSAVWHLQIANTHVKASYAIMQAATLETNFSELPLKLLLSPFRKTELGFSNSILDKNTTVCLSETNMKENVV